MKVKPGYIFKLKEYNRMAIVANAFSFNDKNCVLLYPLSSAIYLAGSDDFVLLCTESMSEPMMCETWNPLIVNDTELSKSMLVGTLQADFMSLYTKYLWYKQMGLKATELSVFTGSPIKSSIDIRLEFRKQEFNTFSKIRASAVDKLIT